MKKILAAIVFTGTALTVRGAATEVFVQRDGRWLNTGWQLAASPRR
jgi:hypothetical protein